jgi:hypothetical protein
MHHARCRGSGLCTSNLRALRRAVAGLAAASAVSVWLMTASSAHATVAGDYCQGVFLKPAETCVHEVEHLFIETEGWSEKGKGNCNGVMNKSFGVLSQACDGDSSPPDEVYCLSCKGLVGWAFIHNHSGSSSDKFTGWLYAEW